MNLELVRKGPQFSHLPVVLFVHGVCHGAWVWELLQDLLEKMGIISYALSLRGHGNSDKPRFLRWASMEDYLDDISAAIHQIGAPVVLVGHSMGGWLVQHYAQRHSEWVKGVIPLCAPPPWGVIGIAIQLLMKFPLTFFKLNLKLSVQEFVGTPALFAYWMMSRDFHEGMEKWFRRIGPESYWIFVEMLLRQPDFEDIIVPVCVIGGAVDVCFPRDDAEDLADMYTQFPVILQGPHDLMLIEETAEALAHQIRVILEEWLQ